MMEKIIRQGDILFRKVDSVDTEALVPTRDFTVALGEETGHHHSFTAGQVLVYKPAETAEPTVVEVKSDTATLTHQEHLPIEFEQGTYTIHREQEFNPFTRVMERTRD